MSIWKSYRPTDAAPWSPLRVAHLHRRAGFAATWHEIHRDAEEGADAAVTRLLQGRMDRNGLPAEFEQMANVIGDAAVASNDPHRLKAWWVYRFLFSPDPLTEKLTLLWHSHFATSNLKVDNLAAMRRQNEIFRRHGRGPFGTLLRAVVRDPAMLIYLDADANRKGSPNENLAREIMELFTLGIGNYTEHDVKEAARALTGWSVRNDAFVYNADVHDDGKKTILGQTGNWWGDDLVRILLEHPSTSRRLAWRICGTLMGEGQVGDAGVEELAQGLRMHDLDIGWALETVLRSQAFFSDENIAVRIASPVEFAMGAVHALEGLTTPLSTLLLAEWITRMGQDLFYPPNVGGWSGGRDWLSGRYIVARANFAAGLVEGKLNAQDSPIDVAKIVEKYGISSNNLAEAIDFLSRLMFPAGLPNESRNNILASVERLDATISQRLGSAAASMLALPEAQFI